MNEEEYAPYEIVNFELHRRKVYVWARNESEALELGICEAAGGNDIGAYGEHTEFVKIINSEKSSVRVLDEDTQGFEDLLDYDAFLFNEP